MGVSHELVPWRRARKPTPPKMCSICSQCLEMMLTDSSIVGFFSPCQQAFPGLQDRPRRGACASLPSSVVDFLHFKFFSLSLSLSSRSLMTPEGHTRANYDSFFASFPSPGPDEGTRAGPGLRSRSSPNVQPQLRPIHPFLLIMAVGDGWTVPH